MTAVDRPTDLQKLRPDVMHRDARAMCASNVVSIFLSNAALVAQILKSTTKPGCFRHVNGEARCPWRTEPSWRSRLASWGQGRGHRGEGATEEGGARWRQHTLLLHSLPPGGRGIHGKTTFRSGINNV